MYRFYEKFFAFLNIFFVKYAIMILQETAKCGMVYKLKSNLYRGGGGCYVTLRNSIGDCNRKHEGFANGIR